MSPDVPGFSVYTDDGLEALGGRQRRPVAEMQEVVVLEPLRQVRKVDHLKTFSFLLYSNVRQDGWK